MSQQALIVLMDEGKFRDQYARLKDVHPQLFGSVEKMTTTWSFVQDLDIDWFTRFCDRIVMAMNPRSDEFDIGKAASGERRHRRSVQFAEDVSAATKNWNRCTEEGLGNVLAKYKSGSLVDAIEKSRKGEL